MDALERCRRLLALAEHPNTSEAEAAAAFDRAFQIMALEGIARAQVDALNGGESRSLDDDPVWLEVLDLHGEFQSEQDTIIQSVIRPLGCAGCVRSEQNEMHIVGRKSDVERALLISTGMLLHVFNEMRKQNVRGVRNRRSFLVGFAARVGARMREQYKKAAAEGGEDLSKALAKRDDEATEMLRKYFRETYGVELGRKRMSARASAAGMAAGDSADIGQARFGRAGTRAIGTGQRAIGR